MQENKQPRGHETKKDNWQQWTTDRTKQKRHKKQMEERPEYNNNGITNVKQRTKGHTKQTKNGRKRKEDAKKERNKERMTERKDERTKERTAERQKEQKK